MIIKEALEKFYEQYELPVEGGVTFNTFKVPLGPVSLTLPNPSWRKERLHIHDIEHIINSQHTDWEGEVFIASWEIVTGYWRYFPLCIFPLWAIGLGWWIHPRSIWRGTRKGFRDRGIAGLSISKEKLLKLSLKELHTMVLDKRNPPSKAKHILILLFLFLVSEVVFLSPLLAAGALLITIYT